MKKIPLTQGKFALVDDEDFDWLNKFRWYLSDSGYAKRDQHIKLEINKYSKKTIWMHRIINNTKGGLFTDHINQNKLDNRKENLRTVTKSQNGFNRGKQSNNTSGVKGVSWHKKAKKWMVEIKHGDLKEYFGLFINLEDAKKVREKAEMEFPCNMI